MLKVLLLFGIRSELYGFVIGLLWLVNWEGEYFCLSSDWMVILSCYI